MTAFHYWVMTAGAISSFAGVASLFIAFRVMRVNTRHLCRLHDVSASFSGHVKYGQQIMFVVRLKCVGLPLQSPKVCLRFRSSDNWGSKSYKLTTYDYEVEEPVSATAMERGSMGTFAIVLPYDFSSLESGAKHIISDFNDPARQNARIEVFSDEYLVQTIRADQWYEWFKKRWNHLAFRVNSRFDKHVKTPEGNPRVVPGRILPAFKFCLRFHLESFARMVNVQFAAEASKVRD